MGSREERIKALLQQRRQTFALAVDSGTQSEAGTRSPLASKQHPSSKHMRIQQLLMQRRMAQNATTGPAIDSSDGESVEGELLSPGSSMSSLALDVDQAHIDPTAGSATRASGKVVFGGGRNIEPGSSSQRGAGGQQHAGVALGMHTIEEESPGSLQDSPIKRTPLQQQPQLSPSRGIQGLVHQQLHSQEHVSLSALSSPQQQSQMQSSSQWHSGVVSLSQGLGKAVQDTMAAPSADDEAVSQDTMAAPSADDEAVSQGEGHGGWGMTDNFSFGRQSTLHSNLPFAVPGPGQPMQLQEGSSSSSGGKRQRIEVGMEGDSASVSGSHGGRGGLGGRQEGSSCSYTMSAGSAQGGSSSSAGGSSGGSGESKGGVRATSVYGQAKKATRVGDLRSLEEHMAQAMHQITLGQGAGDGPFDISDLWAASSVQSASQSETASLQHTLGSIAEEGGVTSKQIYSPRALSSNGTGPSSSHARAESPTPSTSTSDARHQLKQIQLQIRLHQQAMAANDTAHSSWEDSGSQQGGPAQPLASTSTASWGAQEPRSASVTTTLQPQQQQQQQLNLGSVSTQGQAPQEPHVYGAVQGQGHGQSLPNSPTREIQGEGRTAGASDGPTKWTPRPASAAVAAGQRQQRPQQQQQRPGSAHGSNSNTSGTVGGRGPGPSGGRGVGGRGANHTAGRGVARPHPQQQPMQQGPTASSQLPASAATLQHSSSSWGGGPQSHQGPTGQTQGYGFLQGKLLGPESDGSGPVEFLPGAEGSLPQPQGTRDRVPPRTSGPATAFGRCLPKERPRSTPHERRGSGSGSGSLVGALPEYPFRPKMNEMSRNITDMSYPKDREMRLMLLSLPKAAQMKKYDQMRKELEEQQLQECTFQPKLCSRPPSPNIVRLNDQEVPVHDRLYKNKLAWEAKREKLLQERDMAQLEGCTFQPATNSNTRQRSASTGRVPLHKRVAEVLRTKNEHLSQARISMEQEEAAANFRPVINARSLQMMGHRQSLEGLQPGERMYYEAMEAKQRNRPVDFDADAACTFAPAINDRSRTLLATSGELPAAFLQRQQYLAALAAEKKAVYRSLVEGGDCTFTPRLNSGGKSRRASGSWNSEDWEDATSDRLTKLAYQDARQAQAVKEALREQHYAQYTFAPEINPRSRAMGKRHTIEDLHSNEKGARCRARAAQAADGRYEEDCTFKPALDPNSLALATQRRQMGAPSLLDRLDHDTSVKMRNARLQEARAQREYEEMKECTFTPEVNKGPPPMPEPSVNIPGLSRYAELQELAKRKKEEEQRRQDEVWRQHPKGSSHLFTVPRPFNLETDLREQRSLHYSTQHQAASSASDQRPSTKADARKNHEALKARSIQHILMQNEAAELEYED